MDIKYLYPNGQTRAVTLSYDDGTENDIKLVEIFNKYGMKCTFNLDGRDIEKRKDFYKNNAKEVYEGHEIAVHGKNHRFTYDLTDSEIEYEVLENKKELMEIFGGNIFGMAYPYGQYNKHIEEIIAKCGIKYSRTCVATKDVTLPDNFLEWASSCHHSELCGMLEKLINNESDELKLLYVWGHSYEFDRNDNWNVIEDFCKAASKYSDVWFATNGEIYEYITAIRGLEINGDIIYNPSKITVLLNINGKALEIKSGENRI